MLGQDGQSSGSGGHSGDHPSPCQVHEERHHFSPLAVIIHNECSNYHSDRASI